MMVGSAHLLADLLRRCTWGVEQDFGYQWRLPASPESPRPGIFSLHLRTDPADDDAPGLLFAREIGLHGEHAARGVLLHAAICVRRTEALTAAVLDDRGAGNLTALAVLLDAVDSQAAPVAA